MRREVKWTLMSTRNKKLLIRRKYMEVFENVGVLEKIL